MKTLATSLMLLAQIALVAQSNTEPLTYEEVDLKLETSQQIRNGLFGSLIVLSAMDMNNNGDDQISRQVFIGTVFVAILDNSFTIHRRKKNLRKSLEVKNE